MICTDDAPRMLIDFGPHRTRTGMRGFLVSVTPCLPREQGRGGYAFVRDLAAAERLVDMIEARARTDETDPYAGLDKEEP